MAHRLAGFIWRKDTPERRERAGRITEYLSERRRLSREQYYNYLTNSPFNKEVILRIKEREDINLFTDIFLPPIEEELNMKVSDNSVYRVFDWFRKKRRIAEYCCPNCGGNHQSSDCRSSGGGGLYIGA